MTILSPSCVADAEQVILAAWREGTPLRFDQTSRNKDAMYLSLGGLDRILELSVEDGVAVVEAGARVQAIREAAASVGLWCPPLRHLPADEQIGVAVVGGRGWRSRAYGGIADYLLGSRFVAPAVGVVRHGGTAIKNATGYNLTALVAGSRGTLGVILSVNLRLVPVPREREIRCYRVPVSRVATVAATLGGTMPGPSSYRFDADCVLARIQNGNGNGQILVEMSASSLPGLSEHISHLDDEARSQGAQLDSAFDWSIEPPGHYWRLAVTPREVPIQIANILQTVGSDIQELRFEATGGGIDAWLPETTSPPWHSAPPQASTHLRDALRNAFDPDGLLQGQ